MDHRTFGKWIAAPVRYIIGPLLALVVAFGIVLWLLGYMGERVTGFQTLPESLAPTRPTDRQKIANDQAGCAVKNVLVDMKAASNKSNTIADSIIKTVLNQKCFYNKSLCNILYDMDTLRPLGKERKGVPRRNELYMGVEFIFEGTRIRQLTQRVRDLEKQGYGHEVKSDWLATHYIRPDRKRTAGNQTSAEKAELKATLDEARSIDGFTFFRPKKVPDKCLE